MSCIAVTLSIQIGGRSALVVVSQTLNSLNRSGSKCSNASQREIIETWVEKYKKIRLQSGQSTYKITKYGFLVKYTHSIKTLIRVIVYHENK